MTIFSCNNLSKRYEYDWLFKEISFGMESGERIGLIGKNGIGKTTLIKIIGNLEQADEGNVVFNNSVRYEYLDQMPTFDSEDLTLDVVMSGKADLFRTLEEYKELCSNDEKQKINEHRIQELIHKIDSFHGWNLENEAKSILDKLGIKEFFKPIKHLSGGLKKRVALAKVLLSNPELLILDEPTNHLDADSVQWLQDRLMSSANSLLFITHDRYFLDSVSTRIIELDQQRLFSYPGNYEHYLERKENYVQTVNSTVEHIKSRLRLELAWLQTGAKARRTKQKSRIDWIDFLKEHNKKIEEKKIKIELGKISFGNRVIDAHYITKTIGNRLLFKDFTYIAKPGDRIGIIGPNGSGKSTLLNTISGRIRADEGTVKIGEQTRIGYFTQENIDLKENQSVIGTLREIAEFIDVGVGRDRYLTAKDLLNRFLFPPAQHSALISTLSGGERRRLAILRVFMANPNVLLLDEPTNDLDIPTLNALEDYLEYFQGVLIVVSHDRAFLDRTVEFILSFDGMGGIKEYPGNYSNYLEKKESEAKAAQYYKDSTKKPKNEKSTTGAKKLSYIEERELKKLEILLPELENKKTELQEKLNSGKITDYKEMEKLSHELVELEGEIDINYMRWLELEEKLELMQ